MLILPAIDLKGGNCVRLVQGRAEQETIYSNDPVEVAIQFKKSGAKFLHIADLDGAFEGKPINLAIATKIKNATGLPTQIGGGYRDLLSIEQAVKSGMSRVILGTAAVANPALVTEAVKRFGAAIAVSIDVSGDYVAIAGWKEISAVRFEDLAMKMVYQGIQHLLFTDTRKDGTLSGPNIAALKRFLKAAKVPVIASGGMSGIQDVVALKPLATEGLEGVIIGKALYDHRITLEEALKEAGAQA